MTAPLVSSARSNHGVKQMWLFHSNDPSLSFLTAKSNSDESGTQPLGHAAAPAMTGIRPPDENEDMLAAQLVATHSAAMECYRLGMVPDETFEGRRESLNQAGELVRAYAVLVEALNHHRGSGTRGVAVEHIHVHQSAQALARTVIQGG